MRTSSIGEFLWRRALRIVPALWVLIAVSALVWGAAVTRFDLLTYYTSPTTHEYLLAMFFRIRQFLPGTFENNPLQQGFNGSLWTLPLEVRCYLVLALCAVAGRRWFNAMLGIVFVALGLVVLRHFTRGVFRVNLFVIDSFLFLKLVVPFFIGSAIARLGSARWCNLVAALVACAGVWLWSWLDSSATAYAWLLWCVTIGYLTLVLALQTRGWLRLITEKGDFSYGLYLYAFPVQQTLIAFFPTNSVATLIAATTVLTGALAWLSWHFVEAPMLEEKSRLAQWLAPLRALRSAPNRAT